MATVIRSVNRIRRSASAGSIRAFLRVAYDALGYAGLDLGDATGAKALFHRLVLVWR